MLEISPSKVARIIIRARELDAKTARWDTPSDDADAESILESRASDATEDELRSYISDLNEDEQASLVAIMWIGRETFSADDLQEAIETAKSEASAPTADYLLGIPLLSDYLQSGLEELGHDSDELIDAHLK
ncbi:DUF3775 domain-containing protein [Maritimibacter fusiformis]|jgi:hypothetical protein|uniref:DUF3775 domain-containing protein n=1 Tax=Maritimibacter fusiformis TaxID=2603819 RepID=A0A5D0RA32_9RHOB|nr:DUF3775 domain-containing protein [Maritimibacter fusiformis]TYB77558.1 DUF3775 domain-containing protein [Maritimibacter fusiformis]